MPEHQADLPLDTPYQPAPAAPPEIRDEIARTWSLPLGESVEVCLRDGQIDAIRGRLEIASAPDFPWDPHQPLQLRIAGYTFSSRDIEHWTRL